MTDLGEAIGWGVLVGASLLAGAVIAVLRSLQPRVAALVTTFGGGLLFAAVAFELVPEADDRAGAPLTAFGLIVGMLVLVGADARLSRNPGMRAIRRASHAAAAGRAMPDPDHDEAARGESMAVGLFVDGVPESVALGLTIAEGEVGLALLAGVVVGNLAEAYGAAQAILAGGRTQRFVVLLVGAIGVAVMLSTLLGATVLADASAKLIGGAQALAAGGVLAVLSISIIPHAFHDVNRLAAVSTVTGFVVGFLLG